MNTWYRYKVQADELAAERRRRADGRRADRRAATPEESGPRRRRGFRRVEAARPVRSGHGPAAP